MKCTFLFKINSIEFDITILSKIKTSLCLVKKKKHYLFLLCRHLAFECNRIACKSLTIKGANAENKLVHYFLNSNQSNFNKKQKWNLSSLPINDFFDLNFNAQLL